MTTKGSFTADLGLIFWRRANKAIEEARKNGADIQVTTTTYGLERSYNISGDVKAVSQIRNAILKQG